MKNKTSKMKKRSTKIKGLVVLLVLFSVVLMPILSSADQIPPEFQDSYHGHLEITAQDITLPFNKNLIDTSMVVEKAKPSTKQVGLARIFDVPPSEVKYFISDDDLNQLNFISSVNHSKVIKLYGLYNYYCANVGCECDYPITGYVNVKVSFQPTTYTVTFDGNGGTVGGEKTQSVSLSVDKKGGSPIRVSDIPTDVRRTGHSFKGWSTSKETLKAFTMSTLINDDTMVYAFWEKLPPNKTDKSDNTNITDKKEPKGKIDNVVEYDDVTKTRFSIILGEVKTPSHDGSSNPLNASPNGENISDNKVQAYTKAEFTSLAQEQNIPVATIGNGSVPLRAPAGTEGWAFVNLILAAIGICMALVCLFISIKDGTSKKSVWFVITGVSGIAGLALFFITENIKENMVLVDSWTILNAIFFVASIVGMILYLKRTEDVEEYIYNY